MIETLTETRQMGGREPVEVLGLSVTADGAMIQAVLASGTDDGAAWVTAIRCPPRTTRTLRFEPPVVLSWLRVIISRRPGATVIVEYQETRRPS